MNESTSNSTSGHPDDARDGETKDLEQALTSLRPSAGPIDRDRLMFLAGRAIAEREMGQYSLAESGLAMSTLAASTLAASTLAASTLAASGLAASGMVGLSMAGQVLPERGGAFSQWLWPSTTAVATVAASVLGLLLAISHRPLVIHEKVYVQAEPTMLRNPGQPELGPGPPGVAMADAAAPGTMSPVSPAGEQGILHLPGDSVEAAVASREEVDTARIDFAPRTSLPPSNYVQNRRVALSLGVEALGSWTPSGGEEHPVAYREQLDGMMSGAEIAVVWLAMAANVIERKSHREIQDLRFQLSD